MFGMFVHVRHAHRRHQEQVEDNWKNFWDLSRVADFTNVPNLSTIANFVDFREVPKFAGTQGFGEFRRVGCIRKIFLFFYFFHCEKANALGRGWLFVSPVKLFNASNQGRKFSKILVDFVFSI